MDDASTSDAAHSSARGDECFQEFTETHAAARCDAHDLSPSTSPSSYQQPNCLALLEPVTPSTSHQPSVQVSSLKQFQDTIICGDRPLVGSPLLSWHHEECLTEPYLRSNHSVAAAPMPAACHWNHWAPGAEWFQGESEQQCRWNVSACFMYRELTSVMQIGFCPTVVSTTASNLLLHPPRIPNSPAQGPPASDALSYVRYFLDVANNVQVTKKIANSIQTADEGGRQQCKNKKVKRKQESVLRFSLLHEHIFS